MYDTHHVQNTSESTLTDWSPWIYDDEFLLATSSVHVTAAAADYLQHRLDSAADHDIVVVAVHDPDAPSRDAGDAVNVARSRLAAFMPATETRDGAPVTEILAAVDEPTRTNSSRPPPWDRRQRRRRVDGSGPPDQRRPRVSSAHCRSGRTGASSSKVRPRSTSSSPRHRGDSWSDIRLGVRRKRSGCARSRCVERCVPRLRRIHRHRRERGWRHGRCRCADVTESASLPRKQVAAALAGRHYKRPPVCGRGSGDGLIRAIGGTSSRTWSNRPATSSIACSSACALSADFARARRSNGAWAGQSATRPSASISHSNSASSTTRRRRLPRSRRHRAARRRTSPAPVCGRLRRRQRRTAHPGPVSPLSRLQPVVPAPPYTRRTQASKPPCVAVGVFTVQRCGILRLLSDDVILDVVQFVVRISDGREST